MMPFTRQLVDDIDQFQIPCRMFQESSVGAGATSDSWGPQASIEVQPPPLHLRRKSPMTCIGEALLEFCFAGVCCWK
jgi:hypothetical protein